MRIVLAYISALDFWRSALSDEGSARMACRARILPDRAPHALAVQSHPLAQSGASSFPVHLLAHGSQRKASDILVVHQAKDLPDGSLRQIVIPGSDEPLLTTSPELTFVHMASLLSFPRTVHLGYELCGTFAPDESKPYGVRDRKPLTTPAKLASYLNKAERMKGAKRARSALPYILGMSASPRESTLAELITLPCHRGGSGIENPEMNAVIPISSSNRWATDRSSFRCDLLWRDQGVAVEYDSTLCHTGAERIANDASRRNALEPLGLTVVTATWRHVTNYKEYNRFARILAKHLGTRIRPNCPDYPNRQLALRSELLR